MKADKLYLVGFMGAGKTTVGRALARRLDWRFEDIDERIEKAEGRDVAAIFRQSGEPYFRTLERQALADLLTTRGVVVATGGGTPMDPANRALMARDGVVAWLDAPFTTITGRVPAGGRSRPTGSRWSGCTMSVVRPIRRRTPASTCRGRAWTRSSITSPTGWNTDALPGPE